MIIIRGPLYRGRFLAVPSGQIDLRPPKIIVGVSLTLLGERGSLPPGVVTLPAILDTGFNRTFEIDEGHLVRWAGIHKEHLETIARDKVHDDRKYDLCKATLWLHRVPFEGPLAPRAIPPMLLARSTQIRVMATTGKPNPRLPLLGLNALIENKLQARIDGENTWFRIDRSIKSILSSFFANS
jgi:hypothetical protein